jgi:hypothetical protein
MRSNIICILTLNISLPKVSSRVRKIRVGGFQEDFAASAFSSFEFALTSAVNCLNLRDECLSIGSFSMMRLLGLFGIFMMFTPHLEAQTSYLMACRSLSQDAAILESSHGTMKLSVPFTKGQVRADQGIPEGTCTWMDRGLTPQEPRVLKYEFPSSQPFTLMINLVGNTALSTGPVDSVNHNPVVDAMGHLWYFGYVQYFWVYNVDNKFFQVVRAGP